MVLTIVIASLICAMLLFPALWTPEDRERDCRFLSCLPRRTSLRLSFHQSTKLFSSPVTTDLIVDTFVELLENG